MVLWSSEPYATLYQRHFMRFLRSSLPLQGRLLCFSPNAADWACQVACGECWLFLAAAVPVVEFLAPPTTVRLDETPHSRAWYLASQMAAKESE